MKIMLENKHDLKVSNRIDVVSGADVADLSVKILSKRFVGPLRFEAVQIGQSEDYEVIVFSASKLHQTAMDRMYMHIKIAETCISVMKEENNG